MSILEHADLTRRFHVQAWGSKEFPDLDYYTDTYPFRLDNRYPFVTISVRSMVLDGWIEWPSKTTH